MDAYYCNGGEIELVTYKTHLDDGDWTGAGGNPALQKLAMDTLVSNAAPAALAKALNTMRTRPASFGQMAPDDGYAVRWVPDSSFVSPCDVRTTLTLTGIIVYAPSCTRQLVTAYLAALKSKLPSDVVTSVVSAVHVSSGCRVVTSSAYPGSQQGAAMDLAGRLVPSNYPLNGTAFGAGSKTPVFFAEGAAATGQQRGMVTARHLLLDAAAAMSPTTGKASATPIPGSAFAKYEYELQPVNCAPGKSCPTLTFTFATADAYFSGLSPGTTYNVTVEGISKTGQRTAGQNTLQFTTPSSVHLESAQATSSTTATATATTQPAGAFPQYMFSLRKLGCITCKSLNFPSSTATVKLHGLEPGALYNVTVEGISKTGQRTPGDNMLQLTMPAGLRLTQAKATGYTTGTATARALPSDAFTKFVFTVTKARCTVPPCPALTFTSRAPSAQLTGLEPGTKYNVTVLGVTKTGQRTKGANMMQLTTYMFTVKKALCPGCPKLEFNSSTRMGTFTSLAPNTAYTVTVAGVDKNGRRTQGSNSLQFKTPTKSGPPPPPTPTLKLTSARATTPTTAIATASPQPPGAFVKYNVTVAGMDKSGRKTQGINMLQFKTLDAQRPPPRPTPAPGLNLTEARGLNPTRGMARVSEKPAGYFAQFIFTVKKAACPSCPALHFTSNTTLGVFSGLTPNTTYQVTVVGVDKRGQRTPGSNALQFRTPASGFLRTPPSPPPVPPKSLRLISADATSPTSGTATAQPQPAGAFVKYIFTLQEVACPTCEPLAFNSTTSVGIFTGLKPNTKYKVTVVGQDSTGGTTAGSNMVSLTTQPFSKGPSINGTESVTATSGIIDLLPPSGLTCARFIVEMCPMPRTYNVTVNGVDTSGSTITGSGMAQLTTQVASPPVPPPSGICPGYQQHLRHGHGHSPSRWKLHRVHFHGTTFVRRA
ncbi:hypothetical protein CHLNCDRAFT_141289 [Chlorella variabilis]|uniref:Fibronectin type-III domain-containing protein n=1 Tax=Chlorella variabilis TaxID=554065 RepID=E1ZSJ3_CHLVA|nr:hypothetical protein CHLNCDRAFT_141289 [Chlorella variabilis]EFN51256.1 hypothetical protein CHLNCDRAFT_141289 [Chlorella variabilis]|eukprot:XP_005843358.1 hypothetical protein CHLNCDRAFT_141289 [Chlorella variabilis]